MFTRDTVVFCRMTARSYWPAQVKSVKRSGQYTVELISRSEGQLLVKQEEDVVSFDEGMERVKGLNMPGMSTAIEAAQELIEAEEQALIRIRRHSTPPKKLTQSDSKHSPTSSNNNSKRKSNTKSNIYNEDEEISPRKKRQDQHSSTNTMMYSPPSRMATRASPSPCRSTRRSEYRDVSPARQSQPHHNQRSNQKKHLNNSTAEKDESSRVIMTRSRSSASPVRKSPRNHSPSVLPTSATGSSSQLQNPSRKQEKISAKKDASTASQLRQRDCSSKRGQKSNDHHRNSASSTSPPKRNRFDNGTPMSLSPTGTTNQANAFLDSPEFGASKPTPSSADKDRYFQLDPNALTNANLPHPHYLHHPLLQSYPMPHPAAFMGYHHMHPNHNNTASSANANTNQYMCFPKIPTNGITPPQMYPNPAELINNAMLLTSLLNQVKPAELALTQLLEHLLPQKNLNSNNNNNNNGNSSDSNSSTQNGSNNNNNNSINPTQNTNTTSSNNASNLVGQKNTEESVSSRKLCFDELEAQQPNSKTNTNNQYGTSGSFCNENNNNNEAAGYQGNPSNSSNAFEPLLSSPRKNSDSNEVQSQTSQFPPQQQQQQQQRHSVVIPSPKRIVPKNLSISSNSSFLRAGSASSLCPIHSTLKNKILPMLEGKIRANRLNPNSVVLSSAFESDKGAWLCEIVDCVRHLKTLSIDVIYQGEYAMLLEQVYDALLTLAEQTDSNFTYVLSMLTRTMTELDRKIIKHLHDYSRVRGEKYSQTREISQSRMYAMLNAIKIEDEPTIDVITTSVKLPQSMMEVYNQKNAYATTAATAAEVAKVKVMFDSMMREDNNNNSNRIAEQVEEQDDDDEEIGADEEQEQVESEVQGEEDNEEVDQVILDENQTEQTKEAGHQSHITTRVFEEEDSIQPINRVEEIVAAMELA